MADFHVLTQDTKRRSVSVVFHFGIPAALNAAGITWRDAVVQEHGGAANIVSTLPAISTEEDSALKSGALLEQPETVRFSSINLTNAQRLAEIQAVYTEVLAEIVAEKQISLEFMGLAGSV